MPIYTVDVRGFIHATKSLEIEASNPVAARLIAERRANAHNFAWDLSLADDVQVEACHEKEPPEAPASPANGGS